MPMPCADAVAQVVESRRLVRNAFFAFSVSFTAQMLDVATTAKAKHDLGCIGHDPCLVEENKLFPITAGLVAGKAAWVVISVVLEYVVDRWIGPRPGWLGWLHWGPPLASAADGLYHGVDNLRQIQKLNGK